MHHLCDKALTGLLGLILCASAAAESTASMRERMNRGTVTIVSGGVAGTGIRIASDLANILDNADELRVLPIVGKGSIQSIDDMLYLKGVDVGIVQSDVLEFLERQGTHPAIGQHVRYITKLYNEELHLLAGKSIGDIRELAGRKVNFGGKRSGSYMTASIVFDTLGLEVERVSFDQELALAKLRSGEIAALVYVSGKPTSLFSDIAAGESVHFLSVNPVPALLETYLPSQLTHQDYPQLIEPESPVQTLAIGAVMAVYNWERGEERYERVARFLNAFFDNFHQFRSPPRHAKWKEVNLAAEVPGWIRYPPAAALLRQRLASHIHEPSRPQLAQTFGLYLREHGAGAELSEAQREVLFRGFIRWYEENND